MFTSFSGLRGNESSSDMKQQNWHIQEFNSTLEEAGPNGIFFLNKLISVTRSLAVDL